MNDNTTTPVMDNNTIQFIKAINGIEKVLTDIGRMIKLQNQEPPSHRLGV